MQVYLKCRTAPVLALAGKLYTKKCMQIHAPMSCTLKQLNLNSFLLKVALYH
nr:MAG TPA: hypothetical protein [Caudoviricetes sp.]